MAKHDRKASYINASRKAQSGTRRHAAGSGRARAALPLAALALIVVLGCAGAFSVWQIVKPSATVEDGTQVTFAVPEGASANQIGDILQDARLIVSADEFVTRVTQQDKANQLQPGTYVIVGGTTVDQIITILAEGQSLNTLTIPEGFTIKQIAKRVEKVCGIKAKDFTARANAASEFAADYAFVKDAYNNSLEGFLFPDTYSVVPNATADAVIRMMLDNYGKQIAQIDMKYAEKKNLTAYDVLILASIVEKESSSDGDKAQIAAVFYNRLHARMPLGSDVTTYYAVGKDLDEELTDDDIASDSPYNTRNPQNYSLPPGPICNPGTDSLKAAAKPKKSKALYFFYSSKQKKVLFYNNLDDFNAAWAKYK